MKDVCSRTGLARSTIYKMIFHGRFPPQIKLTTRSSGWILSEVDDWINDRIEFTRGVVNDD
jgi:prophage regulatory protein